MRTPAPDWKPADAWRRLRLEAEAAENYPRSYSLYVGQSHRDVLLEGLLPTLLYIKAAALLDDALAQWIADHKFKLPSAYKSDLNGRLNYFRDKHLLGEVENLHNVREKRNAVAHESSTSVTWQELRAALQTIESALVKLGLAMECGTLEYFAERSALTVSQEPGVDHARTFTYGIRENGKTALEVKWVQKFHSDDPASNAAR